MYIHVKAPGCFSFPGVHGTGDKSVCFLRTRHVGNSGGTFPPSGPPASAEHTNAGNSFGFIDSIKKVNTVGNIERIAACKECVSIRNLGGFLTDS